MMRLIRAELAKLHGSLALLFLLVVPALTSLLAVLVTVANQRAASWASVIGEFTLPIWTMFLFPMATAAFCTLVAQIEYRARSWDLLLAHPAPRWQMFAAKLVVVVGALAMMSLLLVFYVYTLVGLSGQAIGQPMTGGLAITQNLASVGKIASAGLLLAVLQLWCALRTGNFVVPLSIGIVGTLVGIAVIMTGTRDADWFPWVLPLRALIDDEPWSFVIAGAIGGAIAAVLMLIDLSRKQLR